MRSPGYARFIIWLSEVLEKFKNLKDSIFSSFEITGITQCDLDYFHSTIRHVLSSEDKSSSIVENIAEFDESELIFSDNDDEGEGSEEEDEDDDDN